MNNLNNIDNQTKFQKIKLLLSASAFFSMQLIARTILNFGSVWMLDLWVFNIIFVYIFMKYFLHTQIYKHQFYALIVIFTLNFILTIICSSIKHQISEYDEVAKNYGSYFYIVLFYFVFLILSALLCSSEVLQKKLMDIYYVSPYTIIYMFGALSGAFTLIAYIVSSLKSCGNPSNENVNLCPVRNKDYDGGHYYFDNFKIYILNMNERLRENKTSFYIEILLVYPLYSFLSFIKYWYETLVVWHLNPYFVLLSDNIFYGIRKIITLIKDPSDLRTYLKLLGEMIALICYLFYLEIFEIKFCGLNKDTKENISKRGISDNDSNILLDDDMDTFNGEDNNINNEKKEKSKSAEMINLGEYMVNIDDV